MLPRLPSAYTRFTRLLNLWERLAAIFRRLRLLPDHRGRLDFEPLEVRLVPDARPLPLPQIFVGADAGDAPRVRGFNADTGELLYSFDAYCSAFTGGVRLGTGDFTGDGVPDVVTAPGAGHDARIHVYDGKTGEQIDGPLGGFLAYGTCVTGGVFVAAADVDGDTHADIVTGAIHPGGPKVKVFSGVDGSLISSFFVPGDSFAGGITVAAADLTGDGMAEVMVGGSANGRVRTYDPLTGEVIDGPLGCFKAFGTDYTGGVFTGADAMAGDVDGDGVRDLALGSATGNARVRVLSGATGDPLYDFLPFGEGVTGGARVALLYADHDSHADLVVGTGPGNTDTVRVFSGATGDQLTTPVGEFAPFGAWDNGVMVAATNDPPNSDALVNTYTTGRQGLPAIAADADGDFVVAWYGLGPGGAPGLYARLYDEEGTPRGTEFLVTSHSTGFPSTPAVAMDADGDFVVAWESPDQKRIFFRLYDEAGTAQTTATEAVSVFPSTGTVLSPSVGMDADGDFLLAWAQLGSNPSLTWEVNARLYDETGSPQTTAFRVNSTAVSAQQAPSVGMDEDGDFVVAWQSQNQDGSGWGVYAQRYNSTAAAQGTEFRVNSTTSGDQYDPSAAMDPDGNFVVAWTGGGGQDGHGAGVYAQRYNATGAAQGTEFRVNTYTTNDQLAPSAAMDEDGDFIVAWASDGQDGSTYGIYAQRVTAGGVLQGPEFRVNSYTTTGQDAPAAAMDADGHFVIAWHGVGAPDPEGVYIRDIGPDLDGQALVAVEGQAYSGVVATVLGTRWSAASLEATIQWGDGTSSTGTMVTNSGTVQVTGSHTYGHEGVYALAVRVAPTATGVANYALGLGLVVDPNDDRRFETVATASVSGGLVLPDTVITSPDWFQGTVGATVGYTFTETVNEPDGSFTLTQPGTLVFSLSETGSDFPQPNSDLTLTQTESSTRVETDRAPNLYGSATETGSGTYTLTQSGAGADYTWTRTGTGSSTRTEAETVGDGTYTVTQTRASTTSASGENDAVGDTITVGWTGTESSTRVETGYHSPQTYTQTQTSSGSVSGAQDGGFTSQDYARDETHTGTYTLTQSNSNTGGTGTQVGNGTYTQTLSADGDEGSGSVTVVDTDTRGYTGTSTATLSGVVTTSSDTRTGSDSATTSGNQITGTFTLVSVNAPTSTSTATTVNQGVTSTRISTNRVPHTGTETGTTGAGTYTLTGTGTATASLTGTDLNQGVTSTSTQTNTSTTTSTQTGDRTTSSYTLSATDTYSTTSSGGTPRTATQTADGVTGRHTLTVSDSGTGTGSSTLGRTGTLSSGTYTLSQTSSSTTTNTHTAVDDTTATATGASRLGSNHATDTQTATQTATLSRSGNDLTGSYTLHETGTSNVSVTSVATAHGDYSLGSGESADEVTTGTSTVYQTGTRTLDRTGSEVSGSYSLGQTQTTSVTEYGTATGTTDNEGAEGSDYDGSDADRSTAYQTSGSTLDRTGNEVTGSYSLHEIASNTATAYSTSTDSEIEALANGGDADYDWGQTATSYQTTGHTLDRSGNEVTGSYSLHQVYSAAGSSSDTATDTSDETLPEGSLLDDDGSDRSTAYQSGGHTLDRSGNSVSTSYSEHEVHSSTNTLYSTATGDSAGDYANGYDADGLDTWVNTQYQVTTSTADRTGNEVSGDYSRHEVGTSSGSSTGTGTDTSADTARDTSDLNGLDTSLSTSYQTSSSTADATGNYVTGTYSFHEVNSSSASQVAEGTDSPTDDYADDSDYDGEYASDWNSSGGGGSTTDRTGNEVSGHFWRQVVSASTNTMYGTNTNDSAHSLVGGEVEDGDSESTSTSIARSTSTSTSSGNDVTASYSLTEVNTSTATNIGTSTASSSEDLTGGDLLEDLWSRLSMSYQTSTSTYQETSSGITGSYSQHEVSNSTASSTGTSTATRDDVLGVDWDQDGMIESLASVYQTSSSTVDRTGNSASSSYSEQEVYSDSATVSEEETGEVVWDGQTITPEGDSDATHTSGGTNTRTGNWVTGAYSVHQTGSSDPTTDATSSRQGLSDAGTGTGHYTWTYDESGNEYTGNYTSTEVENRDYTRPSSGTDSRGTYTGTQTDSSDSTTTRSGNHISGDHTVVAEESSSGTWEVEGGDGATEYTRTETSSYDSTATDVWDADTNLSSRTAVSTSSSTVDELGSSTTTDYSIVQTAGSTVTDVEHADSLSGVGTLTHVESNTSSLHEEADEGTADWYTLDKTEASDSDTTRIANAQTGDYTLSGASGETSTAIESMRHGTYTATFTEILAEDVTALEGEGNDQAGQYALSESGTRTANFRDDGTDASGTFHVTEGSSGSFERSTQQDANTGETLVEESSVTGYSFTETVSGGSSFTLSGSGTDSMSATESGNALTGDYSRDEVGTDVYTLNESGTLTGGTFTNSVTGTDTYASDEIGDHGLQTYDRTTTGGGTWTRTASGAGATLASGNGTNTYTLTVSADQMAGHFSQSRTGTDRYKLVEKFDDVSNANSGATPGNVKYSSHGLPFRDPTPIPEKHLLLILENETLRGIIAEYLTEEINRATNGNYDKAAVEQLLSDRATVKALLGAGSKAEGTITLEWLDLKVTDPDLRRDLRRIGVPIALEWAGVKGGAKLPPAPPRTDRIVAGPAKLTPDEQKAEDEGLLVVLGFGLALTGGGTARAISLWGTGAGGATTGGGWVQGVGVGRTGLSSAGAGTAAAGAARIIVRDGDSYLVVVKNGRIIRESLPITNHTNLAQEAGVIELDGTIAADVEVLTVFRPGEGGPLQVWRSNNFLKGTGNPRSTPPEVDSLIRLFYQ